MEGTVYCEGKNTRLVSSLSKVIWYFKKNESAQGNILGKCNLICKLKSVHREVSYPENCSSRRLWAYSSSPYYSNQVLRGTLERGIEAAKALEELIDEEGQNRDKIYEPLFRKKCKRKREVEIASLVMFHDSTYEN